MTVADWVLGGIALAGLFVSGFVGMRQVRSATAADEDRAAAAVQQRIADARAEERAACEGRLESFRRENAELANERDQALKDRDGERTRADNLQMLINQWRLGGRGG